MKQRYDVAIIGAGPIGSFIASELSKTIESVALFEQHKTIGLPMNCAGLVTQRVFDEFNIPRQGIVQNEIKGANIHSPSDHVLSIGGDKVHALSINRTAFDQFFISSVEKRNIDLFLGEKIVSIQNNKNTIELSSLTSKKTSCSCLIGADGPFSKVRDLCGFPQPKEYIRGIGAIVENIKLDPSFVEIFVGLEVAPGFFAWMIPINPQGTCARIGLGVLKSDENSPNFYFNKMFENKNFFYPSVDSKIPLKRTPFALIVRGFLLITNLLFSKHPADCWIWIRSMLTRRKPFEFPIPWLTFGAIRAISSKKLSQKGI